MLYKKMSSAWFLASCLALSSLLPGQQLPDERYGEKIREYTTDPRFVNEMVDHLPHSNDIPSPLDYFGTIVGAPDVLHYTDEIHAYFRALAAASPRVSVNTIGRTEEDREMIEVVVSDRRNIDTLETNRRHLNDLADPRHLSESEARSRIAEATPIYYVTGGLHSTETGPPEMLMELAYRLAVEETPLVQAIRHGVILVFCPVAEPDGRDRMVDIYRYRSKHRGQYPFPVYWGKYVSHDNNRDGLGLALALTRHLLNRFLYWKPQVLHDLHESVPYLYTSTGKGPYNDLVDAITVNEWHLLAHQEVSELTRMGMPGVWTHGFYNGWSTSYLCWIANLRNSIGRFYETFGNSVPDTLERKLKKSDVSREWYRTNPPLEVAQWSLRNNTNYMQSGLLVALQYVAENGTTFLDSFYRKSVRSVEKGQQESPHAWVIPFPQRRASAAVDLVNLMRDQGLEVHVAVEDLMWNRKGREKGGGEAVKEAEEKSGSEDTMQAPAGSYVIRLDQPYRAVAQNLMSAQKFPPGTPPPYDDSGWTLRLLRNVEALEVNDPAILSAPMVLLEKPARLQGEVRGTGTVAYLLDDDTETGMAQLRFALPEVRIESAEEDFDHEGNSYRAGTYVIPAEGNPADLPQEMRKAAAALGLRIDGVSTLPQVSRHEVGVPRIALIHSWLSAQDSGWWRLTFDRLGIPYAYYSIQDLSTIDFSGIDVVVMPHGPDSPQSFVAGRTEAGDPVPWQGSDEYRHIGMIDETSDVRAGAGYQGLASLKAFVQRGGVIIAEGRTAAVPIDLAITRRVTIEPTRDLVVRGSVLKAEVSDKKSPIVYGYDGSFPVYFNQEPVFRVIEEVSSYLLPDWLQDEMWEKEVPRTVVRFARSGLLLSGMLEGEKELAGKPMVVDVPVGRGHVVLFANRPVWRWETHGSHALVFNTILHCKALRSGWPPRPKPKP